MIYVVVLQIVLMLLIMVSTLTIVNMLKKLIDQGNKLSNTVNCSFLDLKEVELQNRDNAKEGIDALTGVTNLIYEQQSAFYRCDYEKLLKLETKYSEFCKEVYEQLDAIGAMVGDIWNLDGIEEIETDMTDEYKQAVLTKVETEIDGIEEKMRRGIGDLRTSYFIMPIRRTIYQMGMRCGYYDDEEVNDGGYGQVPGVCEGAQDHGLDSEEDSPESWDEYDDVQEDPEGGEDFSETE